MKFGLCLISCFCGLNIYVFAFGEKIFMSFNLLAMYKLGLGTGGSNQCTNKRIDLRELKCHNYKKNILNLLFTWLACLSS